MRQTTVARQGTAVAAPPKVDTRTLQRRAVDAIKRNAIALSVGSPRAEVRILTEYLWSEEGAESAALHRVQQGAPRWLDKLVTRHLADERRHAQLLRDRLGALGASALADRRPPALAKAKVWWLERACAPYSSQFSAGSIVVVLAAAAQLEATGVRMFKRHLAVLEGREQATQRTDPTAEILRSILADEKRHAKSCAAAVERLVRELERPALEALRERIADIDRAFGVSISIGFWLALAARSLRDRMRSR